MISIIAILHYVKMNGFTNSSLRQKLVITLKIKCFSEETNIFWDIYSI
jgi:hypothetical protein